MAEYRLIDTSIWDGDEWFDALAPDEKLLFIYFFSNRHGSISGLYPLMMKYIPLHTGIDQERIEEILAKFAAADKVYHEDGLTWVVNMTKRQCRGDKIPPTLKTRIVKDVDDIPACPLKNRFLAYQRENDTLEIPYRYPIDTRDPIPILIPIPIPNPLPGADELLMEMPGDNGKAKPLALRPYEAEFQELIIEYPRQKKAEYESGFKAYADKRRLGKLSKDDALDAVRRYSHQVEVKQTPRDRIFALYNFFGKAERYLLFMDDDEEEQRGKLPDDMDLEGD